MGRGEAQTALADEELLSLWRNGDVVAGNVLMKRHFLPLQRYFRSKLSSEHDVQDLVQATYVACAEQRRGRGLDHVASFAAYLFGIARYMLVGFYRRKSAFCDVEDIASVPLADLSPGPSTLIKMQEHVDILLLAMDELSIDQQTVIQLKYWQGMRQEEVADAMGAPLGTISSRLRMAKKKLVVAYGNVSERETSKRREIASDDELAELLSTMARRLL